MCESYAGNSDSYSLLYCHLQCDRTPLGIASACGHIQTVRLLMQRGARVDNLDEVKKTGMKIMAYNNMHNLDVGCSYSCNKSYTCMIIIFVGSNLELA